MLATAVAAGAALPAHAAADLTPPIAIRNVRLIQPGEDRPAVTIVIHEGRFIGIGPDQPIPPGADVLDGAGLFAYPGFIDAATDRGFRGGEPSAAERRIREDEPQDAISGPLPRTSEAWRHTVHPTWSVTERFDPTAGGEHRKAGFTTALLVPPAALLGGKAGVVQLSDAPPRRSILRPEAMLCATLAPTDRTGEYPTTVAGAVALFRQTMLDALWWRDMTAWATADPHRMPRAPVDPDLEALLPALTGRMPVLFDATSDEEAVHRALDRAAEFRLRPVLLVGSDAWKCADRLKREHVPVIVSLALPDEPKTPEKGLVLSAGEPAISSFGPASQPVSSGPTVAASRPAQQPLFSDDWHRQAFMPRRACEERKRLWEQRLDNVLSLHKAGIPVSLSTRGAKSPEEALSNLCKMIAHGLPAAAAVESLTTQPAALLGMEQQAGRVAPGYLANLVVMTGPLESRESRPRWVFAGGSKFEFDVKPAEPAAAAASQPSSAPASSAVAASSQTAGARTARSATASGPDHPPSSAAAASNRADMPDWACEIESDRRPLLHTGGNVLLRGATLVTITHGDQPDTDLLIRDGRIAAIGKHLVAPPGVAVVELPGLCISPGMIDCHSHMGLAGGLNEASQSVTPEVRMADGVRHDDLSLYRALAGGVTMIHTMHGSANTIGGQNVVLKLKWGRPSSEWIVRDAARTVKFALGENVKRSNGPANTTRFPASRMGVEATLRRSFEAARRYMADVAASARQGPTSADGASQPRDAAASDAPPVRRDLRLEALADVLEGRLWVHCHCYRADEILRLLTVAEDYGFRVAVLQHVLEGYRIIPEILRHGCAASTFSDWWTYKMEAADAIPFNAARMAQAGIVATVNSDSAELTRHLYHEAAKCVRFGGLSPNDALRLVTLNAAIPLGMADRTGSIDTGKSADLAVFTGHPIDTFSRCVMTLVEGEVYFEARDLFPKPEQAGDLHHESASQAQAGGVPHMPAPASRPSATAPSLPLRASMAGRPPLAVPPPHEPITIPPSPSEQYAIRGAVIHPVSGPPIADGVIIFSPAGIRAVGPAATTTIPPGVAVIDAGGLHVYPGLINASTVLGLSEIGSVPATVDYSELGQFQPDVWAGSAINPHSEMIPVARCEGVTTVLVLPSGGAVAGRCALVHTDGWTLPEMLISIPSQGPAASGDGPSPYGPLAVYPPTLPADLPDEGRDKRIAENREAWTRLIDYFQKARRYAEATRPGRPRPDWFKATDERLEAMRPYVTGAAPIIVAADGVKDMLEAIRFARHCGLRLILRGCDEGWKIAGELAEKGAASRSTDAAASDGFALQGVIAAGPPNLPRGEFEPFDSVFANAGMLDRAGVRFCFGGGDASLVKQVATDAGLAVAYGLNEDRAVHALTLGAAEVLGVADRLGSLEAGKMADVIVTTGHPCQAATRVAAVFINGRPTELSSKHTRNDDRFRRRPPPTLPPPRRHLNGPPAMRIAK